MTDEDFKRLEAKVDRILSHFNVPVRSAQELKLTNPMKPAVEIADDQELDSKWGDVRILRDPPRWKGRPYAPCVMSQTEPAYLEEYASFKDWSARKDDEAGAVDNKGNPKSHWSRKDAARARGWAQRLRKGWKKPEPDSDVEDIFNGKPADDPYPDFDGQRGDAWEGP